MACILEETEEEEEEGEENPHFTYGVSLCVSYDSCNKQQLFP
jgi:hypothetical protein